MGEEVNMEREFSKYLDRILAGEQVEVSAEVEPDFRTALDFAQKMAQLRAVPSQSFKAQLKERLLRELSESITEVVGRRNWFREGLRHLVPRTAAWRAAVTVAVVVIMAVVGVFWGTGVLPGFRGGMAPAQAPAPVPATTATPTPAPGPMPPPRFPSPPPPLEVSVAIEQTIYFPGEQVEIKFLFANVSSEPIAVNPFPPEIRIRLPISMPGLRGEVKSFPAGTEELKLEPGETRTHTLVWDQGDNSGQQVQPGWYEVGINRFTVTKASAPEKTELGFMDITRVLIQHAQGAMEKTIEVNQSRTVNDITITLERAELSATGIRFYAFIIPPGYSAQPPGPVPPLPPKVFPVRAEYRVDGVTRDAAYARTSAYQDGFRLIWGEEPTLLNPIPSDAKELTFTITRLGDWEGPWEFHIPLEP